MEGVPFFACSALKFPPLDFRLQPVNLSRFRSCPARCHFAHLRELEVRASLRVNRRRLGHPAMIQREFDIAVHDIRGRRAREMGRVVRAPEKRAVPLK